MNSIAEMIHSEALRRKITARACELFKYKTEAQAMATGVPLCEIDVAAHWYASSMQAEEELGPLPAVTGRRESDRAAAVRTAEGEA
jgi:hypothetical protein